MQHRWIYVDLFDVKLPGELSSLDARAEAASYVHERFSPFADDGWEWTVHPAERTYTGWLYQQHEGYLKVAGAELLCRRTFTAEQLRAADATHHVSPQRVQQLARKLWVS